VVHSSESVDVGLPGSNKSYVAVSRYTRFGGKHSASVFRDRGVK
jgi:hypothetical protein